MPALISKARTLGGFRRHLVTDAAGAPCCCEGGATGPCCERQWPLYDVCEERNIPGSCCSCGTRWRMSYSLVADYGMNVYAGPAYDGHGNGYFNVRVRVNADAVVRCVGAAGEIVVDSLTTNNLQVTGTAFWSGAGPPVEMGYSSTLLPPGYTLESFLEDLLDLSPKCGQGINDAHAMALSVEVATSLLSARCRDVQPANQFGRYIPPPNQPLIGTQRTPLSLLGFNREACVIGYEPGLRCDCPRSYAYRYQGGSPLAYFEWDFGPVPNQPARYQAGYLTNPTIVWNGSQTCRLAQYSAQNGGTLIRELVPGGGDQNVGSIAAFADCSIVTTVLDRCQTDPCPPGPVPLTVADANRLIGAALGELG